MAKGDFYFPFYYQKILASTFGWKDEEFGAYVRLLIYQYDKGSIPPDINAISRIAPAAKKAWPLLSGKFKSDGKGGLINEVMDGIRNKRLNKAEANRTNGLNGGRPKTQKVTETETHLVTQPITQTERHTTMDIVSLVSKDGSMREGFVHDMLTLFKNKFPHYPIDPEIDYSACVQIAQKIASVNGWTIESISTSHREKVCKRWGEIIEFIITDDWFSTKSLPFINKHWGDVIQSLHGKKKADSIENNFDENQHISEREKAKERANRLLNS